MADPYAPIIALRQSDDAVAAFFTTAEAVHHLGDGHVLSGDDLTSWDFFDARGRRLDPVIGSEGVFEGLGVDSDENHAEHVRQRVQHRSRHARDVVERHRASFERIDETPLTLADEDLVFEIFCWRLASILRPEPNPSDPVAKPGIGTADNRGWFHNTFSH